MVGYRLWHYKKRFSLIIAGLLMVLCLAASSPAAQEKFATYHPLPPDYSAIRVFDRQGRFVGRILPKERYWVSIDRIPRFLQNAVIAVEDARFYEHKGIDVQGIARAMVKNVIKMKMAEGGSTITQQLIKNRYFHGQKTVDRKIQEASLAMEYEKKYTKKQILEMYFNEIYFGNGAWGIAQAALLYFDKNPRDLTEGECALLAGVPKAPTYYNPLGPPAKVTARRSVILKRMAELKMITEGKRKKLASQPITTFRQGEAPYYVAHIRHKLIERYGIAVIEKGGLEVTAAMDLNLQRLAEKVLPDGVKRLSAELQGALICMDPATGDVLAAVGGVDFARNAYNRAFFAKRQPGSAIKPLIYSASLEKGYTAASLLDDAPVTYSRGNQGGWTPLNYDKKHHGEMSLRQALANSNNVITVKLLESMGVPYFVQFAATMGLPLHAVNDLTIALGTEEVTLTGLVSAYTPLVNGGSRAEARTIIRIYDRNHRTWTENPPAVTPALSPANAFVTTQMLRDVMLYGTARSLKKFGRERPAAGKTGTTDDYRDAWFVGYTPQLITGVWVGHDKPRPGGKGFTGGAVAAPIWERFMRSALAKKPAADFIKPDTVVSVTIDPSTGRLAAPDCPVKRDEFYIAGTQPMDYCPKHGGEFIKPVVPEVPQPAVTDAPKQAVPAVTSP